MIQVFFVLMLVEWAMGGVCETALDCRTCLSTVDGILPCQWCTTTFRCSNSLEILSACPAEARVTLCYDCPLAPNGQHVYVDAFARQKALPFIAAANAKDDFTAQTCVGNNIPGTVILKRYSLPCDLMMNECLALIGFSPIDNAVILTFRSTDSTSQLLVEALNFMFQTTKDFQPVGGKVVSYFYDAFFALWNGGLEKEMSTILRERPTANVWVFGHSLGGALASLAASWMSRHGMVQQDRLRFLSFGQPRTGNLFYAQAFDLLVPYKYRVVHQGDVVTKLPIKVPLTAFTFHHHRYEVYYPNDMTSTEPFVVCLRAEDPCCSQACNEVGDWTTHRNYFNVTLADWPSMGCQLPQDLYRLFAKPWWEAGGQKRLYGK